ncbi:hypothetical protein MesoLjLc_58940 [Mesorhizobium sp. L-8-10]|uniref:recombinase family protein n=1 Tax=Mesorhizobium sp. L-8-10 TaxID=2744523 RepID=UPI0019261467|nr:recombinase family protein [Mesorhizobium sp. L-8-10]BCH33964.1 hypothetical protein MesoLjLc_58940 [Mesorhizobium sp. L-8-10]
MQGYAYYHADSEFKAIKTMAERAFIDNLYVAHEIMPLDDTALRKMLRDLRPADTVFVASIAALSDLPSEVLDIVAKITAAGATIVSAEHGGPINPLDLRRYLTPFLGLEDAAKKIDATLQAERQKHRQEIEAYGRQVQERLVTVLMKRGIDMAAILSGKDEICPKTPTNPSRARDLKAKRLALGITQEQAGLLVPDKAVGKSTISAFENDGTGPRIDDYELWLNFEASRRKVAEQSKPKPEAPDALPLTTQDVLAAKITGIEPQGVQING